MSLTREQYETNLRAAIEGDEEGRRAVAGIFLWGPLFSVALMILIAATVYGLIKLADLIGLIIAAVV